MHVTRQDYPPPGNLVLHITGAMNAGGTGWGGNTDPGIQIARTCYVQNGVLLLTGMPDTITKLPYSGTLTASLSEPNAWDVKWIFTNNINATGFTSNVKQIQLDESMFQGPVDSFSACVLSYNHGSLPLKTCKQIIVKTGTANRVVDLSNNFTEPKIYPNPVYQFLSIELNGKDENGYWEMYSSTGVLVQTGTNFNEKIDMRSFEAGCFYLKVVLNKSTYSTKIIKL